MRRSCSETKVVQILSLTWPSPRKRALMQFGPLVRSTAPSGTQRPAGKRNVFSEIMLEQASVAFVLMRTEPLIRVLLTQASTCGKEIHVQTSFTCMEKAL